RAPLAHHPRPRARAAPRLRHLSPAAGDDGLRRGVHEVALLAHAPRLSHHRRQSALPERRARGATRSGNARAVVPGTVGRDQRTDGRIQTHLLRMVMKIAAACSLALWIAASSVAALSKQHADFPKGPAQYLLTKDELTAWKSVQTDEQAQAFIDQFWARRDPTPGTVRNEFHEGFDERVKIADAN